MAFLKIKRSDLKFGRELGVGGFGTVYQAIFKRSLLKRQAVAVKRLNSAEQTREIEILPQLDHPNIIKLYGVVDESPDLFLVMELCKGGSVREYLNDFKGTRLPLEQFCDWVKQAALPIQYLKKMKIVHKDIKTPNYLICKDGRTLKLGDFGLARKVVNTMSNATSTASYAWMAPELFTDNKLSLKYDIFSFGVVVWEFFTTEYPHKGLEPQVIAWRICQEKQRLPIPDDCPKPLADFLRMCWHVDWRARPSIDYVETMIEDVQTATAAVKQAVAAAVQTVTQRQIFEGPWELEKFEKLKVEVVAAIPKAVADAVPKATQRQLLEGEWEVEKFTYVKAAVAAAVHKAVAVAVQNEEDTAMYKAAAAAVHQSAAAAVPKAAATAVPKATQRHILEGPWELEKVMGKDSPGELIDPHSIAVSTNANTVAVADHAGPIQVYSAANLQHQFTMNLGQIAGGRSYPTSVKVGHDDMYYVTDRSPFVLMFAPIGEYLGKWAAISPHGMPSDAEGTCLVGLTRDMKGQILVGEVKKKYISVHQAGGSHVASIRVDIAPWSLAVTLHDTIVISDWENTVHIVNSEGQLLDRVKPPTHVHRWGPAGITYFEDTICICNAHAKSIHCYSVYGEYLSDLPVSLPGTPRCLAFTPNGRHLWVAYHDSTCSVGVYKLPY